MPATDDTFIGKSRCIGAVVIAAQRIFRAVTSIVRRHELTESQYNALRILRGAAKRDEHLTQAELAERLIASRANTTWILDKLEERKLITRRDHRDRRKNIVEIAPPGQKLLLKIDPEFEAMLESMLGEVPEAELDTLQATLGRFRFE